LRPAAPLIPAEGTMGKGSTYKIDKNVKESHKDTYFPAEFDMGSVGDDVKKDFVDDDDFEDEDYNENVMKFSEYFNPLTRIMIKVFTKGKQVTAIPTLLRDVVDRKKDRFIRLGMMSHLISRMIDKELNRIGLVKTGGIVERLCASEEYDYGDELDICIDSFDKDSSNEFYLTSENYEELFVMAFDAYKSVTRHVHIDKLYI
jgi:hypothetical protein